ncbi:hypothetical protein AX14_002943, partial [Amanita brunnescens Koide BX004]
MFWLRMCTAIGASDLGLAEAFMFGDVACDNLLPVFQILVENEIMSAMGQTSSLFNLPRKLFYHLFVSTAVASSISNMNGAAHYDFSNDVFSAYLSKDMNYSSAIFDPLDGKQESREDELYEAQMQKMKYIIEKAGILPGHRVLDVGCGWGSLAIMIAETIPNTTVDAVTLSPTQVAYARERVAQAGLSDRVKVYEMDYQNMPADWEHAFDRVLCVEVIPHIGKNSIETFWAKLDWAMKLTDGICVVMTPTISEKVYSGAFHVPTITVLMTGLNVGSGGRLIIDSVANNGKHYARTYHEWHQRFLDRFYDVIVPILQQEHPEVVGEECGDKGRAEIEIFKRKWMYHFAVCEFGFGHLGYG